MSTRGKTSQAEVARPRQATSSPRRAPPLWRWLWNLYGRCYDTITALQPYQDMLDEVVAALAVAPGMRILDAGCGTGALAERLAATVPSITYLGVDLSSAMLARARRRRSWPETFAFREGDLDAVLAHDSTGFDRIASVNVIWTLPDPGASLGHMTAALRPGGHMVHSTPHLGLRAHAIVWRHLRCQRGFGLLRAALALPKLLFAGLINLILVAESQLYARAPDARTRWSADGLTRLMREAGALPEPVRSCYAGQGLLLIAQPEKARAGDAAIRPVSR